MGRKPVELRLPLAEGVDRVTRGETALVVGGGLAGVAAATVLAERGVRVTLLEREAYLGGRVGAWTETLNSGESFEMERGFHAFFRQYYNLRALLRRIDPELELLTPLEDYPILGPHGEVQSFADLPRATPANLIALVARSPAIGLLDLLRVNKRRALEMLTYERERTYGRRDGMNAGEYLDSLNFPPQARRLFFDVFAHSFFNPEREMSAGELLMMFHFYFTGNPEGLVFDVARTPFSTAIWAPFRDYLEGLGCAVRTGCTVDRIERGDGDGWTVLTRDGAFEGGGVVLALPVAPLQRLIERSPHLRDPRWCASIRGLRLTNPFAVWRLWLDRPTRPGRSPFVGTTGLGPLDNISLYHLFEDESRSWSAKHGGSVVELHAYAIGEDADDEELKAGLLAGLHELYPETREAKVLEDRYLVRRDCPSFAPDSDSSRPSVDTPFDGVAIAGDFVKLPIPSALMERATAAGFLAANHLLARSRVRSEPILSVPMRGLLTSPLTTTKSR